MDPYLEYPGLWPDVHHELISEARALLNVRLRPKYLARIEERVYVSDEDDDKPLQRIPDIEITTSPEWSGRPFEAGGGGGVEVVEPIVARTKIEDEVREARIEVLDVGTRSVVTVIELLSPANKARGSRGWASIEQKRQEVLNSESHWVEIDLLRGGVGVWTSEPLPPCEYVVHVSRVEMRPNGQLWPIRLAQRLPKIPIPLKGGDPDASLDLQAVLATAYDRAGYDLSVDYTRDPVPPLPPEWAAWADRLLKERGLRTA
jgi:hypothetical protein